MQFEAVTYAPTAAQPDGPFGWTEVPTNRELSRTSQCGGVRDEEPPFPTPPEPIWPRVFPGL